ncbi:hypothetical protein evm_003166 [Chilo suppressalis]|nr:hypothetical protein evm_003166 [Chilo suppressalis]
MSRRPRRHHYLVVRITLCGPSVGRGGGRPPVGAGGATRAQLLRAGEESPQRPARRGAAVRSRRAVPIDIMFGRHTETLDLL